jgi:hypothetical protein
MVGDDTREPEDMATILWEVQATIDRQLGADVSDDDHRPFVREGPRCRHFWRRLRDKIGVTMGPVIAHGPQNAAGVPKWFYVGDTAWFCRPCAEQVRRRYLSNDETAAVVRSLETEGG